MRLINFPQANQHLRGDKGNHENGVHFHSDGKVSVVCVEVTKDDINQLIASGKMYVLTMAPVPAPVQFMAANPFIDAKKS